MSVLLRELVEKLKLGSQSCIDYEFLEKLIDPILAEAERVEKINLSQIMQFAATKAGFGNKISCHHLKTFADAIRDVINLTPIPKHTESQRHNSYDLHQRGLIKRHPGKLDRWICSGCSVDVFPPYFQCPTNQCETGANGEGWPPDADNLEAMK